MHARRFVRLASFCVRHPKAVLLTWLVLTLLAASVAWRAETVLHVGQAIHGSQSESVQERLHQEFDNPFTYLAVVTLQTRSGLATPEHDRLLGLLQKTMDRQPDVGITLSYADSHDPTFGKPGQRSTFLLAGLRSASVGEATDAIPRLRQGVKEALVAMHVLDPTVTCFVTSDTAFNYDLRQVAARDSARAEARVIPLTLALLIMAFGPLVAATVPVIIGVVATTLTLGLAFVIGHVMTLSVFILNVASMIGLGVGIDYGLFMVSRFREERRRGLDPAEAAAVTVQTTGVSIAYSGLTVMIGFAAMLLVPIIETRSIGLGGLIEVGICVALALTAVPAALTLIGDRLDSPKALGVWLQRWKRPAAWEAWTHWVMTHPKLCLFVGLVPLALLIVPLIDIQVGIPDNKWMPRTVEAAQGFFALEQTGQSGILQPIRLLVDAPAHGKITDPGVIDGVIRLTAGLQKDRRIAHVRSLVSPQDGMPMWQAQMLFQDPVQAKAQFPQLFQLFVNRAETATMLEVIPANGMSFEEGMNLVADLRRTDLATLPGLGGGRLTVGGLAGFNLDFHDALMRPFPTIVATVLVVTGLMLFVAFRSLLIPIKAIVLNCLSVAAAFGAAVLVFQKGYGIALFGLSGPTGIIIVVVPILVFCIVYGLSMDYEVFMLSRIQEAYWQTHDNETATAMGLKATGGLITSAALIMIVVFGAFAFAELLIVKMLGFGLAMAVLLDATLIRILLVPAIMRLAGRWNWYPGDKRA
ncbi:MAG: MMPL family transporter [Candidatus Sericytochromatia bacterium]|nr:MMPL family transporter [Candidatus Sericytochromatia bacterium]